MAKKTGQFVVVTTTTGAEAAARKLARQIVAERLAACVQILPIHSVYRWKGKTESAPEYLLLAKTRKSLAGRLIRFIKREHSYEVPEIVTIPIAGGHKDYLKWIDDECKKDEKS